jgi:hypothetical protein
MVVQGTSPNCSQGPADAGVGINLSYALCTGRGDDAVPQRDTSRAPGCGVTWVVGVIVEAVADKLKTVWSGRAW